MADRLGRGEEARRAWQRLLATSPDRLPLLLATGRDPEIARFAVTQWPRVPGAWRLAALTHLEHGERGPAVEAWRRVTALVPRDGEAWLALGDLLADSRPATALEAYARACVHGDPGANACLRGGRLAAAHGADLRAKALYRRSRWPPIRALAGERP